MIPTCSLEVLQGPRKGSLFPLSRKETVLGRGNAADIDLEDLEASRRHCLITLSKENVTLSDQGSANGVFVNDRQVETAALRMGDVIRIGNTELRLMAEERHPTALPRDEGPAFHATLAARINAMGWSVKILCLLLAAAVFGHALIAWPLLSAQHRIVSDQALQRAQVLVLTLAAMNQEALRLGDEMLLETEGVAQHDGVLEVYVYDARGRILAPLSRFHEAPTDLATSRALTAETQLMTERDRGVYDLAEPIRTYNPQTGGFERIGTARIVFSVKNVTDILEAGGKRRVWISLIVLLLAATVLAKAVGMLTNRPITALRDDLEAVLKGDQPSLSASYRMSALDRLVASINRCLIKLSTDHPAGAPRVDEKKAAASVNGDEQILSRLLFDSVMDGLLVADSRNEIFMVNAGFERILGVDRSQLKGRHFFEAFADQKFLSATVKLVQEAVSADHHRAATVVNTDQDDYQVQATVHRKEGQPREEYAYLIIAVRPLNHKGEDRVHA